MRILEDVLPINIWVAAKSQASRSTLRNFKTGAVIFDSKSYSIKSRGCSHVPNGEHVASIHAEHHALQNYRKSIANPRDSILIVCIGKSGNFAFSSRPCYSCTEKLFDYEIENIYYAERLNSEQWVCNIESPAELLNRTDESLRKYSRYAKEMRL